MDNRLNQLLIIQMLLNNIKSYLKLILQIGYIIENKIII